MANKVPVADRFVHATHDKWGNRQGPALGFVIHMAEGTNVWRYLSGGNVARDVSVHFTVEIDGEIVQMLELQRISGSINPGTIRTDNDANGNYGVSHNRAVLGEWWRNPNHVVITVEVAGRAKDGPNEKQIDSIDRLFTFLRGKYPSIKPLGHRDFQNVKPCPGQKMYYKAYPRIGGHGKDFRASDMDGGAEPSGGGDSQSGDTMIIVGDSVVRQSNHFIELPAGTEIFESPNGEKLRTLPEARKFDYFGWSGGWRALEIRVSGERFEDGVSRAAIAYVRKDDAQVVGEWPVPEGPTEPEPPQQSDREVELESALLGVKDSLSAITAASNTAVATVDDVLQ